MSPFDSPKFLRYVLLADSASCLATGAAQVGPTATLSRLLGVPQPVLLATGLFLLAYAVLAAVVATRDRISRPLVALFVAGNAAWAVGCVALLASGPFALSAAGQAWLALQAVTVVVLAELQWTGLRRSRAAGRA